MNLKLPQESVFRVQGWECPFSSKARGATRHSSSFELMVDMGLEHNTLRLIHSFSIEARRGLLTTKLVSFSSELEIQGSIAARASSDGQNLTVSLPGSTTWSGVSKKPEELVMATGSDVVLSIKWKKIAGIFIQSALSVRENEKLIGEFRIVGREEIRLRLFEVGIPGEKRILILTACLMIACLHDLFLADSYG